MEHACVWRLSFFGRPAAGFFLKQAMKKPLLGVWTAFRCGQFGSCRFGIDIEEHGIFAVGHLLPALLQDFL